MHCDLLPDTAELSNIMVDAVLERAVLLLNTFETYRRLITDTSCSHMFIRDVNITSV
jgi:hypothetical protein